ncbi:TRAM domain-containing protein [Microbacterium sp. zg-Y818]|uniref:class I SAM-dependent RNA methyltransferase n=2 Tax=Microbacterium TaxID=33882 RepID=UPI00214CCB11|nr:MULTISPECIES: TRAM domain-containing protein [unclassified Microbacterium]MCR2801743.1 TRAM domain-containing protein [Microbacterium sp. zg.Y818]WIM22991.1 TRAM domain-containing protein [Microbacterium sp. zg-Y818]
MATPLASTDALIDLDVTDVAHGGVFVGRNEGRVVFVPDALPGERVRVRLTDVGKASFWRGEVLEVLDASPHRRPHIWRQADVDVAPENRPGGADFGHIELTHQRELKQHVVTDALQRFAGLTTPVTVAPVSADGVDRATPPEDGDGTGWRTRLSLHVDADGRVGPYAARSHRVVTVEDHPLAAPDLARVALELKGVAPGRIDLVLPADGRVRVLPRPEHHHRAGGRRPRGATPTGNRATGANPLREVIVEEVAGRQFRVDAGGFWQVHRFAARALTQVVSEHLNEAHPEGLDPEALHLDLYGGVGLFAAALGDIGGPRTRVISVESDSRATEHAGENLSEWVGARAETGRVDRWVARWGAEASPRERDRLARGVVVLDPPRSGAGREVVQALAALAPQTIVYVACDPVALARDVATFRDAGYAASRIDGLDLFPHSHHVEAVATLIREEPRR